MSDTELTQPDVHGIDGAVYQNTPAGLLPTLFCECGQHFQGDTWEEAGAEYDEHLREADADHGRGAR